MTVWGWFLIAYLYGGGVLGFAVLFFKDSENPGTHERAGMSILAALVMPALALPIFAGGFLGGPFRGGGHHD